jgi:hypothetical protein
MVQVAHHEARRVDGRVILPVVAVLHQVRGEDLVREVA